MRLTVEADNKQAAWAQAIEAWAESLSTPTRRTYRFAWHVWHTWLADQNISPDQATDETARMFIAQLSKRGLAAASINQRLAALSSAYRFAQNTLWLSPDADFHPLCTHNPLDGVKRLDPQKQPGTWLDAEQARALLQAISTDNLQGIRDYTLILFYLLMGWQTSEVCTLRWSDFKVEGDVAFVRRYVDQVETWAKIPSILWETIQAYKEAIRA